MPITLGPVTFDLTHTTADEQLEEVGGRDARVITLRGIISNADTIDALESQLDAIAQAASKKDYAAVLSLRDGRVFYVRRARFKRDVSRARRVAAFELTLETLDPFEQSLNPTTTPWAITESGATIALTTIGNADTFPVIALTATGTIVNPAFDDGIHRLTYTGSVTDGQTLTIDGPNRFVTLDSQDVTPYTQGEFPGIAPAGTTLLYEDDAASTHIAEVTITHHDRWW